MIYIEYDKINRTNIIKLTRGDDVFLNIVLTDQYGKPYELQQGDELTFSLKRNLMSRQLLISKKFYSSELAINHEDTCDLDFGDYVYDIQLRFASGKIFTVIGPSKLIIMPEVNDEC